MNAKITILSIIITMAPFFISCGSSHPTITTYKAKKTKLGNGVAFSDILQKKQSSEKVVFQKVRVADWEIHRSGLIYLGHPKAKQQNITEGQEKIQIYMYVLDHPTKGRIIIDSGISDLYRKPLDTWPIPEGLRKGLSMNKLKVLTTNKDFFAKDKKMPNYVLLTHLHMDHIMGLADIPPEIPVFTGPNEASSHHESHKVFQNMTDKLLGPKRNLQELKFPALDSDLGIAVLDFFDDGSLIVFHVPGHTAGSLAFLVQAKDGTHLVLGDSSHTAWGWKNEVPPGSFTEHRENNVKSLRSLKKIAKQIPGVKIHPGHQSM
ncbi:MAG: MBL fold metallo-hydrolase [Spirochaetota bacterium]